MKNKILICNIPELRFPEFINDGEWEEKKISDVCDKPYSGGTPASTNREFYGGSIPFIRSAEINKEKTELLLTYEGLKNSSAKLVKKGDILVALYGANSGDVAISKIDGAINQAILCLNSKDSNSFLFQYLTLKKDWIVAKYIQGGQGNLSGEIVKSIQLDLPKPKEQQKIADCLSSIDNLITAQSKKVEALREHKKGLMQQLFPQDGEKVPKLRFPEFKNAPKWEEKKLGDIADFFKGKNISKADINEEGITQCIRYGELYTHYQEVIDKIFSKTNLPISDLFLSCKNDVIIPSSGETKLDIATASCVTHEGIALGGDINIIRSEQNGIFMSYYLNSAKKMDIAKIAQGDTVVHLYSSQLKKLDILLPPTKEEQQKIANFLSSIDELITSSAKKVETLKEHKKGLMQQLFPSNDEVNT